MTNKVSGRAYISMNGQRLTSKEGAQLNFGGVRRETVTADTGVAGYSESTAAPEVECKIAHYGTTSLQDFADFTDGSVMFETDTGKVYTLSNAWLVDPPTLAKGEVSLKFSGLSCVES